MSYTAESRQQIKHEDFKRLLQMYEIIESFEANKLSTKEVLYQLGCLCGSAEGLSFNDKHDPDTYTIRNRYGYKIRNQSNKENENKAGRIDFETLFRLKALMKNNICLPETIATDLMILKSKLAYILCRESQEKLFEQYAPALRKMKVSQGDEREMDVIKSLVEKAYPELILKRLKQESQALSNIKPGDKDSIYIVARKFVIIGELLHEASEISPSAKTQKSNNLFSLFNRFNQFRNGFIHYNLHFTLFLKLQGEKSNQLQEAITRVANNLKILCTHTNSLFDELDKIEELKACKAALDELSALVESSKKRKFRKKLLNLAHSAARLFETLNSKPYLELKSYLKDNVKAFSSEEVKRIVLQSIKDDNPGYLFSLEKNPSVTETFKGLLQDLKQFLLEKELQTFIIEYFLLLEDEDNQQFLREKFKSIVIPDFDIKAIEFGDEHSIRQASKQVQDLHKQFSVKPESEISKEFTQFFNKLHGLLCTPRVNPSSIANIAKQFQAVKAKLSELDESDRAELQEEFNFSISLDDAEKIQRLAKQEFSIDRLEKPISKYTKMLYLEMDYLASVEKNPKLPMRDAIIEHIITLVGQYVRDIEDKALDNYIFLNHTSKIAGLMAKSSRSKGLAHELLDFNKDNFRQDFLKYIYPAQEDFEAIHYITDAKTEMHVRKSSLLYAKLGQAYSRLSDIKSAKDFYTKAMETFSEEIPEDEFNQNSLVGQSELDTMGITQPSAVMIDFNKILFGIWTFELSLYTNLQEICLQSGDTQGALDIHKSFVEKINLTRIKKYQEMLIKISKETDEDKQRAILSIDPELAECYRELIASMEANKRPYVLGGIDETILFSAVADIFAGAGRAELQSKQYEKALPLFLKAFDFITTEINNQGNAIHIPSFNPEKLMDYYINLAQCFLHLDGDSTLIFFHANSALNSSKLSTRLSARSILYYANRKYGQVTDLNLKEYENEILMNMHELKRLHGDGFFYYLEQFYIIRVDYYAYNADFQGMQLYLEKLEKEFFNEYSLDIYKKLKKLCPSVCKSCLISINSALNKTEYEQVLKIAEKYFKLFEVNFASETLELSDIGQKLAIAIKIYAKSYLEKEGLNKTPPSEQLKVLSKQYSYCYETLIMINNRLTDSPYLEDQRYYRNKALIYAEEALNLDAKIYNAIIYKRDGFFSVSQNATERQPYGPYSDRSCSSNDPVTMQAIECTRLANL